MVAYNTQTYIWSWEPRRAREPQKAAALGWMETLIPIESHCLEDAALTTLDISNRCRARQKRVLVLGNRTPFCGTMWSGYPEQCMASITSANYEHTPIDTIFVPEFPGVGEELWWQELAAANHGTFTLVQ